MNVPNVDLHDIKQHLNDSYDLFICSASYEDRCTSIANNINIDKIGRALILSNSDLLEYVEPNNDKLKSILGNKAKEVRLSTVDPLITADNLRQSLTDAKTDGLYGSILVDVTTFTHESLIILLRLLQMYPTAGPITGVYANASEYSIGDTVDHKWLSRGIAEVRSVLGYPGNIVPSRKTHLILIVGYEHERATGIIETIEPHSISLGYGRSGDATTDKDRDANEHYMRLVEHTATSFAKVNLFEISCNDPYGTRDTIETEIAKVEDMNTLLAPMNNKLSTIGATWAAFRHDNVQMCYARALRYNFLNYSTPGSQCYIFSL